MRVLYGVVWLISAYSLSGQSLEGVINDQLGVPVAGATIEVIEANQAQVSDKNGYFVFHGLDVSRYQVEIRSVGFISTSLFIDIVKDGVNQFEIQLEEKIYELPSIVVESITMTGGLAGLNKVLGSAHYIGQKEIQKFSYTDISRTLRQIPGVNIQEEEGYGLRPNIGLRATGSERSSKISVMEDGILMAPAPYAAPAAYYFPTVGRMESIEIMKGSSQVKYGPFTTGGAINLISTPIPSNFAGHADFIAGSDNYRMLHANLGNGHRNFDYLVETMQYSADGFKVLDNGGNTGFNKEDYIAKFRVHTNPDAPVYQSLTLKLGQVNETSHETYLGLTDVDFKIDPVRRYNASQRDLMRTSQSQISLTHFAALAPGFDLHTEAYKTTFERNWYKLDKADGKKISDILSDPLKYREQLAIVKGEQDASQALSVVANNRSYYARGIQSNLIFHKNSKYINHKMDLSLRLHQDQIDRFQWMDNYDIENGIMKLAVVGIPGTESNRIETAVALSTYAQYKLEWNEWTVVPGLRYENITIKRKDYGISDIERSGKDLKSRANTIRSWIPGIGIAYQTGEESNVFGGIHKGFAPPGSKEGTRPEESWNFETGWRLNKPKAAAHFLVYYNNYSNLLGTDLAATGGTGSQDLFNGGAAVAYGIETQYSIDLLGYFSGPTKLPLSLMYTYATAQFANSFDSEFEAWGSVESGNSLPYVPKHQLGISLSAEHPQFFFDISMKYQSDMLTKAGSWSDGAIPRTDKAFTIDVALNYRLTTAISAFVNVNNITDNIYIVSRRPAGVRPNLPRTFNLGLKANF